MAIPSEGSSGNYLAKASSKRAAGVAGGLAQLGGAIGRSVSPSRSGSRSSGGGGGGSSSRSYRDTTSSGQYRGGGTPSAPPRSNSSGPAPRVAPPKPPPPPSIQQFLGTDADFLNTRGDLLKNFQALMAQTNKNKGDLRADFDLTNTRLNKEKAEQLQGMEADFASRGLFGSGVYQDELNDFNMMFQNQFNDAKSSYNRNLSQLMTDLADARRLKDQRVQDARLSAIRRRAEKFGLQ